MLIVFWREIKPNHTRHHKDGPKLNLKTSLVGNGIINADGELWRVQRKAGLRFFSNANLKVFIDNVLPPLLRSTEKELEDATVALKLIDLQYLLLELTTRLMGNVAYDMDIPASLPFSQAFGFASGAIGDRFQNPFYKIKELIWGAPLRKAVQEVKRFGDSIVSNAVHMKKEVDNAKTEPRSANPLQGNLISSLLDHIEDHRVVADAAMNYLSAGRDTTAQSMTWAFYMIMRHRSVQLQILQEVRGALPEDGEEPSLNYDTIQSGSFPYTMAVFNETLRLYPPVPVELKECTTATTFPDGTWLPSRSVVMWVPWAINRSKRIWGEDADVFRPERWLTRSAETEQRSLISKTAFEFPVFNGGPRACLGKKMSELLAVYVLARLVWRYEFTEIIDEKLGGSGEGRSRLSQNSLTLPMEGGLPCSIRRRIRD